MARSVLRYAGHGDLGGTVCSQAVFACLPPDVQRFVRSADPPLGVIGSLLRRWNPDLVTPNQFALAFGVPPAVEVGPQEVTVQLPVELSGVESDSSKGRVARVTSDRSGGALAPRVPSLVHRSDCRLLVGVAASGC